MILNAMQQSRETGRHPRPATRVGRLFLGVRRGCSAFVPTETCPSQPNTRLCPCSAVHVGMNLFVELGQVQEARRLMDAMRAAGHRPGWGAYHILIKYYAQRGDMDGARRMFAQLRAYRGDRRLGG